MKILLTGANGQLGQALQDAVKKFPAWKILPYARKQLDIVDLAQVEKVLDETQPDVVINAAAYNDVDRAEEEPIAAFAANKTGPENLARAASKRGIILVHVSTDYVFDGLSEEPYSESSATAPLSVYGKSKEAGEAAVLEHHEKAYVIRTSWLYHSHGHNFLLTMLRLKDQPEIKIVADQVGCPTYAPHLAAKILDLIDTGAPYGIYHLAGQGQTTWFDFARSFFQQMGWGTMLTPIPASAYVYKARRPHVTVLRSERGSKFELPHWEQGLREFVKRLRMECEIPKFNATSNEIKDILAQAKTVAVIGISPKEDRPSHWIAKYLMDHGYDVVGVNPGIHELFGKPVYKSLLDVPGPIDIVDIFRPAEAVPAIVEEAIQKKAKVIWMQEGIVNNVAADLAKKAGLMVVSSKCIYKEHIRSQI